MSMNEVKETAKKKGHELFITSANRRLLPAHLQADELCHFRNGQTNNDTAAGALQVR